MADSPISGLPVQTTLEDSDLFLTEHNNLPYKITGETLKDYFNANVISADASPIDPDDPPQATFDVNTGNLHFDLPTGDYFVSCTLTGTDGNKSIYTLTSALGHTVTFEVMNGTGGAPSDTAPLALGTASAGIDPEYSRADHVHPKPTPSDINALDRLGRYANVNPVTDLNDFVTGIGLFNDNGGTTIDHFPYTYTDTAWAMVVTTGNGTNTAVQVAFDLQNSFAPKIRKMASGTWGAWANLLSSVSALDAPVPISKGGTGATSLSAAQTALGIADSGWVSATLSGNFDLYNTSYPVKYRKCGNVVNCVGIISPHAELTGGTTQVKILDLPSGYRPVRSSVFVCHGSGRATWICTVENTGEVYFSRYADETGYINAGTTAWLPFSFTYIVA